MTTRPPSTAARHEHETWRRTVGRWWLQYREGGVSMQTLTRKFGLTASEIEAIGKSFERKRKDAA